MISCCSIIRVFFSGLKKNSTDLWVWGVFVVVDIFPKCYV